MIRISEKVFCAFCKVPRRAYRKKHINWTNVALSALLSLVVMLAVWQRFEPKVFVVFVANLFFAELFITLRWRMAIVCPYCGFDPVLYLKDKGGAAEKVKLTLDRERASPRLLLSKKNPFQNLPKRSRSKNKSRRGLSREI